MATNKNITMRQFNGTDYDTLYPKTLGSQIASTVPVSAGGTGINVNPNIHVNLGAENTSNVFEAYPRPGVYGTLPVSHGGTGQTSLAALATAMGAAKIQTGSYVGTGTYGASNPNSLTFPFTPKFVYIIKRNKEYTSGSYMNFASIVLWIPSTTALGIDYIVTSRENYSIYRHFALSNNIFSQYVYSEPPETGIITDNLVSEQLNKSGVTYDYFGIG